LPLIDATLLLSHLAFFLIFMLSVFFHATFFFILTFLLSRHFMPLYFMRHCHCFYADIFLRHSD